MLSDTKYYCEKKKSKQAVNFESSTSVNLNCKRQTNIRDKAEHI